MFELLPSEILILILSLVDRHIVCSIYQVSKFFRDIQASNHYKNFLISNIKYDMDLNWNGYSLSQLKNIFLMLKRKHFSEVHILTDKGNVYYLGHKLLSSNPTIKLEILSEYSDIIQINGSLALDSKGCIHCWKHLLRCTNMDTPKIPIDTKIVRLVSENEVLGEDNILYSFTYDFKGIGINSNKDNTIICSEYYKLNNKGYLTCGQYSVYPNICFIQISGYLLLTDMGKVYYIYEYARAAPIDNLRNIINISYDRYRKNAVALDSRGKICLFNFDNIKYVDQRIIISPKILELDNITEVSIDVSDYIIALDIKGRICRIDFDDQLINVEINILKDTNLINQ